MCTSPGEFSFYVKSVEPLIDGRLVLTSRHVASFADGLAMLGGDRRFSLSFSRNDYITDGLPTIRPRPGIRGLADVCWFKLSFNYAILSENRLGLGALNRIRRLDRGMLWQICS